MRNSVASSASMSSLSATFGRSLRGANLWRGDAGASHGCLQTSRRDPRVSGRYSTAEHAGRLSTARTRQSIPQRLSTENAAEGGAACTHTTISPTLKGSCRSARGSSGRHAVFQTPNSAACKLLPGPLRCSQAGTKREWQMQGRRVVDPMPCRQEVSYPYFPPWHSEALRMDVRSSPCAGFDVSHMGLSSSVYSSRPFLASSGTSPFEAWTSVSFSSSAPRGSSASSASPSARPVSSVASPSTCGSHEPASVARRPAPLLQRVQPGRVLLYGHPPRWRMALTAASLHAPDRVVGDFVASRPRRMQRLEVCMQLFSFLPQGSLLSSMLLSRSASTSRFALAPVSCPLATAASPRFILTGSSAAHGPPSGLLAFKRSVCAAPNGFVVSASVSCASSRHLSPASPPGARLLSSLPSIEAHDASNVRSPSTGAHEYKAQLGAQLLEIDQRMLPDEQQFLQKQYLLDTLGPLLRQHIGGQLVPFGSCANGFWVRGSDVDSCLVLSGCEGRLAQRAKLRVNLRQSVAVLHVAVPDSPAQYLDLWNYFYLFLLAAALWYLGSRAEGTILALLFSGHERVKELVERHRIGEATVVPAQVPIAKVCNAHGKGLIDVSVNNCTALENSIFVETFGAIDDRVRPLGRFIKHWATQRNINNRAEGTLSTYTLMLQLFFFLQQRSPPILPPYTALLLDTDHTKASSPAAPSPCSLSLSSSSPTSDGSSPTGLTPMFSDGEVGGCTPRDADTSRDVAADKEPEIAPRTPAEGLKPLPFCTDIDYIRKNLFPEYGHNKETVGELIHDFFLFYGKRSSKIFSPCDGAIVTVEVYDGSISVCPPLPAFSSSSLGSPFSPSSSSLEALSASYLASAPPSHEIAEVIQPRALPNPPTTGGYRSVAAIFVSSARESEAVKNRRQRDRRHACEERGDIGSSLSMTRRVLMRCPLTRAVVNRFSAAAWKIICDEFQRAEALVETGATLTEICAPAPMKHDHRKKLDRLRRRLSLRALAASRNLLSGPDSIGGSFYGFASGRTNDVGNGQPRSFSAAFRGSHSESLALVESLDKPTSQVSPMLHSVASSSVSAPSSVHLTPVTAPYFSSSSSVLFPDEANCHLCRVAQPSPSVQQSSSSVPVSPSPSSVSPQVHYSYSFSRSPSAQSRSARRRASDDNRRALSSPFLHSFVTASHSPLRFVSRPPLSCFPPPSSAPHARHSPSTSGCGNPRSSQGPMPRQAREN